MVELLWFLAALVPTVLVGVPVALALARPGRLMRRPPERTRHVPRAPRLEAARAFAPLDLGPDPVKWPSEGAWSTPTIRQPDWPSASWNDEHFGKAGRAARAALAVPAVQPAPVQPHSEPQRPKRRKPLPPPPVHLIEDAPPHGPPDRDEVERLIAKVGLAGTVQNIMDRTEWDFRQAAQYLAKIRGRS
jgi:hypothetical protein